MRLDLIGGAYQARWIGANAQRCVNYYPEKNQGDSPTALTHYQRPGLSLLAQGPNAGVRCLYRASNGNGYGVIGQNVYSIGANWVLTLLGALIAVLTTPVKMIDNGSTIVIVDGSKLGYTVDLGTNAFAQIVDSTGIFQGGTTVDTIDTFVLANVPGTNQFVSTLSNEITFNALYFASKSDYPDPIQGLIVNRHEILLIGALKSEIWYDAGNAGFPFAELPGAFIEHGAVSAYSIASQDISVYWLSQDLQGQGLVLRQRGYETRRVSTHAIETIWQEYPTISDAIAYTYQQNGHVFYVLIFPSGNATWVYDDSTDLWHQRTWTDAQGLLNRDRTNCAAFMYGRNVVGDWQNGMIYALDNGNYTDNGAPITFIRGFPHLAQIRSAGGQMVRWDGKRTKFNSFTADIQCGEVGLDQFGNVQNLFMRYSDDRGRTFSDWIGSKSADGKSGGFGAPGAPSGYQTQPIWRGPLGIARDRVFEIMHSANGPAALNGAWVDAVEEVT